MLAEKALVKLKIAAIEEFAFFFFLQKELCVQSLSKPVISQETLFWSRLVPGKGTLV